jgi:1-deoxy-D-xylulose-5-phosphate synthase
MAFAIRFPRGEAVADFSPNDKFEFGKGRILQTGSNKAVLSFGTTVKYAMQNQDVTVVDLRFLKPLDEALILQIFANHKEVILLEDGSIGGVYSSILELLHKNKVSADSFKAKIIPDKFIEHGKVIEIHQELGINAIK